LGQILKSPGQTLKLYSQYKADQHLAFGASENRVRFSVFKTNVRLVSDLNSAPDETAEFGLNFFSSMTGEERKQWLGLNATSHPPNTDVPQYLISNLKTPRRLDWVKKGAVTAVANQGRCASCWAWVAVGALETRYKINSGRLRSFSVQEYLDCSYRADRGCKGGWYNRAYTYSKTNGGRIGATKDYPYVGKVGDCKGTVTPNAALAYKIGGSKRVPAGEDSNIAALTEGALAMAIKITQKFYSYRRGIFKDTTCTEGSNPNHAVTGVGYTESHFVIKNSWGTKWGIGGFMKLARHYHNCGLWKYSVYPKLEATGKHDKGEDDKKARYDGEGDDHGDEAQDDDEWDDDAKNDSSGKCEDKYKICLLRMCNHEKFASKWCRKTCGLCEECKDKHNDCEQSFCKFGDFSEIYCQKTCDICDKGDDDRCSPGLTRCSDGVCRHEHMC
jgi:hypothetical protein